MPKLAGVKLNSLASMYRHERRNMKCIVQKTSVPDSSGASSGNKAGRGDR
jgi:hypothetical protein